MTDCARGPVDPDFDWCFDIVQEVSRTFALTIAELDDPLAREICVGYLLCRVADTVEDATHVPPNEQVALLESYRGTLDPNDERGVGGFTQQVAPWVPDEPAPDWQVVAETRRVLETFHALSGESRETIRPRVIEMVGGMARFVDRYTEDGGLRLQTMAELEEYCWYAAGTVGHLVTGLVAQDTVGTEALYENATSFGLLLQLVNVAKDIAVDYEEENNVYVPAAVLAEHGLSAGDIGAAERGEAFAPVVLDIVSAAEEHTAAARQWLDEMPVARGNTLSAWAIPYLLAIGTLRELRARPADVIAEGDVKVSRPEVAALLGAFQGERTPSVTELQWQMRTGALDQ